MELPYQASSSDRTTKGQESKISQTEMCTFKAIPLQALTVAVGSSSQHMKVVMLSALRTGRLYPTGNIPGTQFC